MTTDRYLGALYMLLADSDGSGTGARWTMGTICICYRLW